MENTRKTHKKMSKKRVLFILCGVTVPVIQWLIFYVYANFSSILMAFQDSTGALSLMNFQRLIKEFQMETSEIRLALRNTFLTFGILFVTFPFKVLVSFFIYKKIPFYNFYRVVFFVPTIVFSVAFALIFKQIVGVEGWIAKTVQEWMGLEYAPELLADSRFANTTVLLNMLWLGFPGDLIIWGGTFARIPEEILEAGRMDGVNWWTEFIKIVVPMVWPTVALQTVLLACAIFSASGNVFLLTGGRYGTMTLNAWMYITLYSNSGTKYTSNVYNYLSAVGLVITAIAITISLLVRKFTDKAFEQVEY